MGAGRRPKTPGSDTQHEHHIQVFSLVTKFYGGVTWRDLDGTRSHSEFPSQLKNPSSGNRIAFHRQQGSLLTSTLEGEIIFILLDCRQPDFCSRDRHHLYSPRLFPTNILERIVHKKTRLSVSLLAKWAEIQESYEESFCRGGFSFCK